MKPDDVQAARTGRLLADLRGHPRWTFTGPDRVRYLNGQVTNDVKRLIPGRTLHAAVTDNKGRMQGEVWIAAIENALRLDAPPEFRETLGPRLEKYLIADDTAMEPADDTHDLYFLAGETPPTAVGGHPVASRRFGLDGWDLWLPAGAPPPLPTAPPAVWEHLRIQNGAPRWGREFDGTTLAPEVFAEGLTIRYDKGCYVGQEVIARIRSMGHVRNKLCRLEGTLLPDRLPQALECGGRPAGRLTSAAATGNAVGGLGIIGREFCEKDRVLSCGNRSSWTVTTVLV